MKSRILVAGIALAFFTPSLAMADDGCKRDSSGRIIGTVAGAGAGGILGNVIAGRGDKTEGTIIGGIIGAVIGNQVTKSDAGDCRSAYGYYDEQGRWHATGVSSNDARGYYDRDGKWVSGQPNGYYDNGRWVTTSSDNNSNGYVDSEGHWVPAASGGYYDRNGRWIGASASGYYDSRGRWVAGPTRGYYDERGRWIAGVSTSNSNSNSMEQPGYYENGRWREGRAYGYYDARGRWVAVQNNGYSNSNNGYGDNQYNMDQMPTDISTRISWLREYIRAGIQARRIGRSDANYARSELTAIEKQNRMFSRDGRFTQREQRTIDHRLDRLTARLDKTWRQARAY